MSVVSWLVASRLVQGVDLLHHLRIEAGELRRNRRGHSVASLVAQHFTLRWHKTVSGTDIPERESTDASLALHSKYSRSGCFDTEDAHPIC
jgi:hypothetical protein